MAGNENSTRIEFIDGDSSEVINTARGFQREVGDWVAFEIPGGKVREGRYDINGDDLADDGVRVLRCEYSGPLQGGNPEREFNRALLGYWEVPAAIGF